MTECLKLFKQGAEAKLYVCDYLGKPTVVKERFQKNYRHPDLDVTLTKERIKSEARAIVRCKTANIKTPTIYLVDFDRRRIYMEHFENSLTVKDFIINIVQMNQNDNDKAKRTECLEFIAKVIGEIVRKMHENNIIHGDLTTSNMLIVPSLDSGDGCQWEKYKSSEIVMIDFGLAHTESSNEDKGVDLYVLERALISTHNDLPHLFSIILEGYKNYSKKNVKEILDKFEEVQARGRKRTMVG